MKKILNLEKTIYLSIIILPLYLLRINFWGIPTNLWEILALIGIFWWIINTKGELNISWKRNDMRYLFIGVVMILIGLIVSTVLNKNYLAGFGIIKSWFLVPCAFSFMAVSALGQNKLKNIFGALYISAFLVALISLIYYMLGETTYDGRLQAFFNSPNYLAMYLSPAVIIAIYLLGESRKQKTRLRSIYISLAIISLALFFTYSYAAWVSVIVSLIFFTVISKKPGRRYLIAILLGIILVLFFQKNSEKFISLLSLDERSSLASRVMIWRSAGKMIEDNWLWGIGPSNFQADYLEYQKYYPPYLEWAVPHPHSLYSAFWLYGGILGLIGFIILIFLAVTRLRLDKKKEIMSLVSFSIIIYFLIHGVFDTTYFKNDLAVVFWLAYLTLIYG